MILEHFVQLRPFVKENIEALIRLSATDNHPLVENPTDVMWKNNEIVGAFSVQVMPIVAAWFSKKMQARDSVSAINTMEQVLFRLGNNKICVPVDTKSNFYPLMDNELKYIRKDNVTMFFKSYG